jgi:hypothetical protein
MNPTAWDLICLGLVCAGLGAVVGALTNNKREGRNIMSKLNELATTLNGLVLKAEQQIETAGKVLGEVQGLRADFDALKGTLENVALPADAEAALVALDARLDAVASKLGDVDAVNPDATAPTA